ncbi:hypothetical protein [Jannaschia marina]|nr:hypothetical protein [Jannaschia marina]
MAKDAKQTREDRLKAALKANMGRRKAQKRVRESDEKTPAPDAQEKSNG